jgi:hypothetical protein
VNVSAEAAVALPTRLRPTADQVCNWYARTLLAMGADVERTGPGQLEFSLRWSHTFFDSSLPASLAPLAGGQLEVCETADGFEVSVEARARNWVGFLPLALVAFTTGGLAVGTALGSYMAFVALGLLGFTWLRTWGSLNHFLDATNAAIVDSYATVPPASHAVPLAGDPAGKPGPG